MFMVWHRDSFTFTCENYLISISVITLFREMKFWNEYHFWILRRKMEVLGVLLQVHLIYNHYC
jgi:hypothetical protein